ncbi:MAG: S-formylglutathione hydrolase [Thalassolituus sp.]|jgi:S-formylglutathione hydrolase|uniref:S-formylglutathione hydrolase n=1 Tax=unclassified Thalassolituus TaxID=2624967 RepID=UPI000B6771DD|nr:MULTISPECIES: S-formylglutathione hydrolase [unclassified Thalassolituus]MBN56770.1 S-formylglutathione hydrolase [Oceanospirillaceae bacterium]MDQ4423413.1 S-formylglutathione hydrolase [Thalassolituus sp.]MDQ4426286.1 S-formylglutathione hydrolase [Thalassolituus sp.]OUX65858.1 MAG: S-formylglutathione hydrolase [Oceanospirillaceae bacterium TMED276]|tara:strand:+ start:737 stop:1570 length:834 start_codon:yes stop_codon:yes gene_type:complete
MEKVSENRCFDGRQLQFTHRSEVLNCDMRFGVYLPPQAEVRNVPVLYWLSGLTCTDENFTHKAGAQRVAAELGIAIVMPDTSPRGEGVPDDENEAYDFGLGAGFYVNATEAPWSEHYRMYDYVVNELPELIEAEFPVTEKRAISGHSMGGHGAITIGLNNPDRYTSISAFSPICHPMDCPWGEKALGNYLGPDKSAWKKHDASELLRTAETQLPLLVDQGLADNFLEEQLKPEALETAAAESGYAMKLRRHEGYDHSYFFISSFIDEHLRFHAKYLG